MKLALLWFKRDLRLYDHAALAAAVEFCRQNDCPLVGVYSFEHEYWQLPDTSQRQWAFIRECLLQLDQQWRQLGAGELIGVSAELSALLPTWQQQGFDITLFSHEETGNGWTYARDKRVHKCCRQLGITWHEFAQFGVRRPHRNRDDWAEHWQQCMVQPCHPQPASLPAYQQAMTLHGSQPISALSDTACPELWSCPARQSGGRAQALALWHSFIDQRGRFYRSQISSPLTAEQACSRLSPYLALGCISVRELLQATRQQRQKSSDGYFKRSLAAFESRLWWHCHFIQKLEDQPDMEWQALHPAYRQLRSEINSDWQQAWQLGQTGWPLVDACMRYLHHHGWLNFRMRAMLMSIISYPLWQPWQPAAQFLAAQFVDYEPGIHYPQVQMQAGTTGINIPRMYNPTLQAQKLDPKGEFIRRWLPELTPVPSSWIHQPWHMPLSKQQQLDVIIGKDYPAPLVNFEQAVRQARQTLSALRDNHFIATAKRIGHKHGSRKRPSRANKSTSTSTSKPASSAGSTRQLSLFE
ncbi:deoxyribodipyrimidine photolyase [Bacterioplanes sanyensis]|uniref:Deoxyribodipyrimidine photolyase n=1 Tax=Bacterioplanes sanyensis TaxID=1249553 RepID=A0A222FEX8_9GAMM|nr:deoxyribodipyrimidine photo-lyase [Bacterioplanes sanyensis]ASP37320.1 deoxyribodipyrimidine photolyase [Bacterioplanes sanyensis]